MYQKEQQEYIQGLINKIRNSIKDIQSWFVWHTVNEASKRKSPLRAKLKAARQEELIHKWKEHFKNLFGNSYNVTDKPITKIINSQLDSKLRHFMEKELYIALTKIKSRKSVDVKQGNLMTYFFNYSTLSINKIQ